MEQYYQPVVVEPEKKSTGLQAAALVLGIIGLISSVILFFSMFANVMIAGIDYAAGDGSYAMAGPGVVAVSCVLVAIVCIVGLILGVVGLIRSISRPTRTVKGIVLSAIGLCLSIAGCILVLYAFFVTAIVGHVFQVM